MLKKIFQSLITLVFFAGAQASANLLTNGDFDTDPGSLNNGSWGYFDSIPGWQEENIFDHIELQTQGTLGVTPHSGRFYAELNSHPAQSDVFSWGQSFDTQADMVYQVIFYHRSRTAADGYFNVTAGDYDMNVENNDNSDWQQFIFEFTASGPTETLQFTSLDPGSDTVGHLIDSVSVTKVPLPGAFVLFGSALLGLVARRRKLS